MIIRCPKCEARHDVSARKPGEAFACACGQSLAVPKKRSVAGIVALIIVFALALPCLASVGLGALNMRTFNRRAMASEARVNLKAIRTREIAYYGEHEKFVAAGPVPATVPRQEKVAFVQDVGFKALLWTPESAVRHQYEVQLTGPKSGVVIARGDIDGDGEIAEYRLEFSADEGASGEVKKNVEDEF